MGATLLFVLAALGLFLRAFMLRSQRRLLASPAPPISEELPGVSILKPLKGRDPSLEENLGTFFRQDYPAFEILLGAADPRDPALDAARAAAEAHPSVPSGVFAGGPADEANPKVANLARLVRHARFPVILVSDSNVAAPPGHLRDMAARLLAPGVGVVSAPIAGLPGRGLGSALESLHLNAFVMGGAAAVTSLPGGVCVVGKSMMLRRRDLEAVGGFDRLGRHLAEDQFCGEELSRLGRRTAMAGIPVGNVLGDSGLGGFASRQVRWGRIRRRMAPGGYAGEILLHPTVPAAVAALAFPAAATLAVLAGTVLTVALLDAAAEGHAGLRRPLHRYLALSPLRDLAFGLLWPAGFLGSTVDWRGRRYRIGPRTRILSPVPAPVAVSFPSPITATAPARSPSRSLSRSST